MIIPMKPYQQAIYNDQFLAKDHKKRIYKSRCL